MARRISLAHELDIAWIIALWLAISGGDPGPIEIDERTAELAGELLNHLGRTIGRGTEHLTEAHFEARMKELGIPFERQGATQVREARVEGPEGPQHEPLPYCFTFRGVRYCVHFPRHLFRIE